MITIVLEGFLRWFLHLLLCFLEWPALISWAVSVLTFWVIIYVVRFVTRFRLRGARKGLGIYLVILLVVSYFLPSVRQFSESNFSHFEI
jgi:hypothetical protein